MADVITPETISKNRRVDPNRIEELKRRIERLKVQGPDFSLERPLATRSLPSQPAFPCMNAT